MKKELIQNIVGLVLFVAAIVGIAVWLPSVALIIIMLLQVVIIVLLSKPIYEKRIKVKDDEEASTEE